MDIEESNSKGNNKGKGKGKASKLAAARAKPINWPPALSEFLLDWYIEKKLQLPPKTVIKKIHHTACTSAINSKYGSTYTVDQVQRHYRRHKENWSLVARHLNESGNGWNEDTKMLSLSKSTLDALSINDRGILSKPIQFFDKLQELFSGCSADGAFMEDPSSAAEFNDEDDEDRKFDFLNDMSTYADINVPQDEDSDILKSDSDGMLKKIALDPDDKLRVGMYLCKPELQANRSFLMSMGQEFLERWIYKFLSGDDPNSG